MKLVRKKYLTTYDYGTGSVWCYIYAESEKQITSRYPELKIVKKEPAWFTKEYSDRIEQKMAIDIDDDKNSFLTAIVNSR